MSIFPTRILLATDGSKEAEMAATTAINVANNTNSELHILTVTHAYPSYDVSFPAVHQELRQQAQNILDEQAKKIEQAGGKVAQRHMSLADRRPSFEHHPSDDVVRFAEEIGAGLIVLGSRGLGGVRRALMGSVSDAVVKHAHCPVMVVRGEPVVFPTKILLATDGSEEAELAAATAADLAKSTNCELHVVHVGELPPTLVGLPEIEPARLEREAQELLDEQKSKIEEAGGTVKEAYLRLGRVDEEIVDLAQDIGAGLIVMGSRGRGRMRRALVGSVSESVVRHAHCAVTIVRE